MPEHSLLPARQGTSRHGVQEPACKGTGSAATMLLLGGCREEQAPADGSTKEKSLRRRLSFTPKQPGGKCRQLPACS